jgi:hypothetical protein
VTGATAALVGVGESVYYPGWPVITRRVLAGEPGHSGLRASGAESATPVSEVWSESGDRERSYR